VSGVGGDVGQGVLKALMASKLDIEFYASCINPRSSWLHYKNIRGFISPFSDSDDYIQWLITFIKKYKIDVFYPTVDSEIMRISQEKNNIETLTGCQIFVDDSVGVSVCDDKFKTAKFLKLNNFSFPYTLIAKDKTAKSIIAKINFPMIHKKRSGKGAQEVYKVENIEHLERSIGDSSFILQEWLNPEEGEYTSGIYIGDDGKVKGICTFRRKLKGGSTYIAERICDPKLEAPLELIAIKLGMKYLNIQSMRRGDKLIPFEFNGRLSGTTAMISRIFNAPEMFIRERILKESIIRAENPDIFIAMRYYDEIYTTKNKITDLIDKSSTI